MYWIIILLTLIGIVKYDLRKSVFKGNSLFYIILFLIILTSTFAYRLGSDAPRYMDTFDYNIPRLNNLSWSFINNFNGRWNIGMILMMSICKTIIPSFYFFKFIYACILNITVFHFFAKNSNYKYMAVLFYIGMHAFYFNYEIFRESMAVCVFLWAYPFLLKHNYYYYYLFCIIAILFHSSAFIAFFLPLILLLKVGKKSTLIFVSLICIVLFLISERLNSYIGSFLTISENLVDSYSHYLESEKYGSSRISIGMLFSYVVNIIIPIIMLYIIPKKQGEKSYYVMVLVMPILVLLSQIVPIIDRLTNYFIIFSVLFYIEIFDFFAKIIVKRNGSYVFLFLCVVYVSFSFYRNSFRELYEGTGFRSIDRYYPYVSMIDQ